MAGKFTVRTRGSNLNVRKGPGTNHDQIDRLANGSVVSVTGSRGEWMQLQSGGWVHRDYLVSNTGPAGAGRAVGIVSPPAKTAQPTAKNAGRLEQWLTSMIAGRAGAVETYTFYEKIDSYLGPWGPKGYPLGYGKKYNVLFSTNEKLNSDPVVKRWVWRTTIILQEELRDFIVKRFRAGTLGTLTEPELRTAAFDSHPKAYTQGGLTLVAITAPELLLVISGIPQAEFDPRSPNYQASKKQVWQTMGLVVPEAVGTVLGGFAGPAHTGSIRRAIQRDRMEFNRQVNLGDFLARTRKAIAAGRVDRVGWLVRIIRDINRTQFPSQGFARAARDVVDAARARICVVVHRYYEEIRSGRESKEVYDRLDPGWSNVACRIE